MEPGLRILSALRGEGEAKIAGPWVDYRGWARPVRVGFSRYDACGCRVVLVTTTGMSHGKWSIVLPQHDLNRGKLLKDPSSGRGWLSSAAAMDRIDKMLREMGWTLLEPEQVGLDPVDVP